MGSVLLVLFGLWTILVKCVDVAAAGVNGTNIGFSTLNVWFHGLTGVNMTVYTITDWAGLVPFFVCVVFGFVGLIQLIKRRSLFKVDLDIILLGVYYIIVILAYLFFETVVINYRPVLIEGRMEASYPSSTLLLTISVMPTLIFQVRRRLKTEAVINIITVSAVIFTALMAIGRMTCGVHWLTDIIGGLLFGLGLYLVYKKVVLTFCKAEEK